LLAIYTAMNSLPNASLQVLAPVGHDPVREADILMQAQADGNLATPFGWGGYATWRLYPRIKISMDGRYETTYPESTFQLNNDFYEKRGPISTRSADRIGIASSATTLWTTSFLNSPRNGYVPKICSITATF
jgi:hypothetical protein